MTEEVLQKFGLSETAKQIYLKLLQTGVCTADALINKVRSSKAEVLEALEELSKKGIVTPVIEKDQQCFRPVNLSQLKSIVEQINKL